MANAEGGLIVIGLHDGRVVGIDDHGSQLNAWRQAAIDFTVPTAPMRVRTVACVNRRGESDHLAVVAIEPGETVIANRRDDVLLRVGDENRRLTFRQVQELIYDKGQAYHEATPTDADAGELDPALLQEYASALAHPDPSRLLRARGLVDRRGRFTIGALLLFGERPQDRLPEATVRVLRYRGMERGSGARQELVEDVRCEGPIPRALRAATEAIVRLQPSRRALDPDRRFSRIGLIPRDAWQEGLVNATVHRSYSQMGDHIRIDIFDDRIEISSPGRFPGLVDPTRPESVTRFARNPRIARVCADLGFGQELGEGMRRIFDEMRLAGLASPTYRQTAGSVHLTLSALRADPELERRLPPGSRALMTAIREVGAARTGELMDATGLSRPVVIRRLRALEREGLIEWVGQSPRDPHALWRVPR